MRFAFTDDQLAFRDAVRDLLEKQCTPAQLRDAWTNDTGRIPGLWDQLVEMGVVGMLAPEADGGLGLTMVDLVLILEETGRFAVPEPIVETAATGVPAARPRRPDGNDRALARAVGRHRRRHHHRRGPVRSPRRSSSSPRESVDGVAPAVRGAGPVDTARRVGRGRRVRSLRLRHRRATVRPERPHARADGRLREGTQAVRRTRRFVPSGEAPSRQRAHRARVRAPARVPQRGDPRPRPREHGDGQGRRHRAR